LINLLVKLVDHSIAVIELVNQSITVTCSFSQYFSITVMCVHSDNHCDQTAYSINLNQSITAVISVDQWLYTKCSTKGQPEPV